MQISQRIIWIFSNSYILRNNSFLDRKTKLLFISPLIFIFGFIRILQYFFLQKSTIDTPPNHLVVRTAASHMHNNYFRLFNQNAEKDMFIYIDCFDKNQFTKIKKLKFWDIFAEFHMTFKEGIPIISKLNKDEGRSQIAYEAMRLIPVFSYFTCLLKDLKNKNSEIKIFSGGADLISASAVVSNIETYWLAHGLIDPANFMSSGNTKPDPSKYFIAYPNFNYVYLYSDDEVAYLKNHGVSSELCLYPYNKLDKLNNKIIIFLNDEDRNMNYEDLRELVKFFKEHEFEIIMKYHPSYKGTLKNEFLNDQMVKIIIDRNPSALKLMTEERPRFISGWLSTTLCEAYRLGIIPICLAKPEDSRYIPYKFNTKSIYWGEEKKTLKDFINNKNDFFEKV